MAGVEREVRMLMEKPNKDYIQMIRRTLNPVLGRWDWCGGISWSLNTGTLLPIKDSLLATAGIKMWKVSPGVGDYIWDLQKEKWIPRSGSLGQMRALQANEVGQVGQQSSALVYKYLCNVLILFFLT